MSLEEFRVELPGRRNDARRGRLSSSPARDHGAIRFGAACAGALVLSGCGGIHDKTEATIEVWNYCGESVTVAIGDGYDIRRDSQEFADFSRQLASGEATRLGSLDTAGSFYVVVVGSDGTELLTRVSKELGATVELRDDLCP